MRAGQHNKCPYCTAKPLPIDLQPYPSLHAFSVRYGCGSQIVIMIGGDYWEWEIPCTREVIGDNK